MTPLRSLAFAGCSSWSGAPTSTPEPGRSPSPAATAPRPSCWRRARSSSGIPRATSYTKGRPDALVYPILGSQGDGPTSGPGSLDWHNYDGAAPRGSARGRPVTMPLEVSAVQLRLRDVMQHEGASTGPVTLELLAWDGVTSIGSVSCVPTAAATDCVSGAISVTGGRRVRRPDAVNPTGTPSSFLAGRFSVEPVASSAPFWLDGFVRLDADNLQWGADALPGSWSNPRCPDALSFSEIRIETNAAALYVESWADTHDDVDSGGDVDTRASFSVDTVRGSTAYVPENTGGLAARERATSFVSVANAGAGGAPSSVTIRSGAQKSSRRTRRRRERTAASTSPPSTRPRRAASRRSRLHSPGRSASPTARASPTRRARSPRRRPCSVAAATTSTGGAPAGTR